MQNIDEVLLFDETTIPQIGQDHKTFSKNAEITWSRMNPVLISFNAATDQTNVLAREIEESTRITKDYMDDSKRYRDDAQEYSKSAQTARNDAVEAKETIESYVIPEEATLSEDAIYALVQDIKTDLFFGFNF